MNQPPRRPWRDRKPKMLAPSLLQTLNAPFVLWVLSTVFISFGSWAFTQWKDREQADAARAEKIARLDTEIYFRLASTRDLPGAEIKHVPTIKMFGSTAKARAIGREVLGLRKAGAVVFTDYSNRTLPSLLAELELSLSGRDSRCVHEVFEDAVWLLSLAEQSAEAKLFEVFGMRLMNLVHFRWSWQARKAPQLIAAAKAHPEIAESVDYMLTFGVTGVPFVPGAPYCGVVQVGF